MPLMLIGEIEGAELLVVAAVAEFDDGASGGGGALGGVLGGWKNTPKYLIKHQITVRRQTRG